MSGYRAMRCGEIVEATDEYISVFSDGRYVPVADCTVGQKLLDCNVPYYRRPTRDVQSARLDL